MERGTPLPHFPHAATFVQQKERQRTAALRLFWVVNGLQRSGPRSTKLDIFTIETALWNRHSLHQKRIQVGLLCLLSTPRRTSEPPHSGGHTGFNCQRAVMVGQ
jgi:hypothetical protein